MLQRVQQMFYPSTMKTRKLHMLGTRVSEAAFVTFTKKANKIPDGNVSEVLRALVDAFNQDRIKIKINLNPVERNLSK